MSISIRSGSTQSSATMKDSSIYYTAVHTLTCLVPAKKETLSSLYLCFSFFPYNKHKVRKRSWNINAITYYHWFFLSYNYLLIHTVIISTNMYRTLAICQTPCQDPDKPDPTRSRVYGVDGQGSLLIGCHGLCLWQRGALSAWGK